MHEVCPSGVLRKQASRPFVTRKTPKVKKMADFTCQQEGCALPARWDRVSGGREDLPQLLCSDHWKALKAVDTTAAACYSPITMTRDRMVVNLRVPAKGSRAEAESESDVSAAEDVKQNGQIR